jgi:flagellin-like hook-associated protein FlgL
LEKRLDKKLRQLSTNQSDINHLKSEIAKIEKEMDNLYDTIAVTGMTDSLKINLSTRQKKIEALKNMLKSTSNQTYQNENKKQIINQYLKYFDQLEKILEIASIEEKKLLVKYFINKVTLNKDNSEIKFHFYKIPELSSIYALHPSRSTGLKIQRVIFRLLL